MPDQIAVGASVVTSDGKDLGRVKEVSETAFLVDAPRQFDYWLYLSLAAEATSERVTLTVRDADLGAYKMDNPHEDQDSATDVSEKMNPGNTG